MRTGPLVEQGMRQWGVFVAGDLAARATAGTVRWRRRDGVRDENDLPR